MPLTRRSERGQTIVEYILLLVAVITLFMLAKPFFNKMGINFGEELKKKGIFSDSASADGFYYYPMKGD